MGPARFDWSKPFYARCSAGKGRCFWVAWRSGYDWSNSHDDGTLAPIASGYEPTLEAAEARGREAAGPEGQLGPAGYAEGYRERLIAKRRKDRPAKNRDSAPLEFLYRAYRDDWDGNGDGTLIILPHRVVRKTAKRIYVEEYDHERSCRHPETRVGTVIIDRAELERQGYVYHRRFFDRIYLSIEAAERAFAKGPAGNPSWCEPLDLSWPCTAEDVKSAYRRKAKELHPDAGGDDAGFTQMEAAYRIGLDWCERARPAAGAG